MTIIPAGKKIRESVFGDVYEDNEGNSFVIIPRKNIREIIEANVTNGAGYVRPDFCESPAEENRLKERMGIKDYSYFRLGHDKFPGWRDAVMEGHPSYSKFYLAKSSVSVRFAFDKPDLGFRNMPCQSVQ